MDINYFALYGVIVMVIVTGQFLFALLQGAFGAIGNQ
jgi:hypothetical protein